MQIKKLIETGILDYLLIFESITTSALVRFVILLIPMKKFAAFLGEESKTAPILNLDASELKQVERIRLAVARTARIAPWRFMCYEQAFTAKMLLKRRKIKSAFYFGVRKNVEQNKINAHAWLIAGNVFVTGKKGMLSFKEIACFH